MLPTARSCCKTACSVVLRVLLCIKRWPNVGCREAASQRCRAKSRPPPPPARSLSGSGCKGAQ
eukprot:14319482-Alexandrium_andersonii.AAC.1